MYLFVDVLKLQLGEIISLELATLFILAIIITPIILGFLSYLNVKKAKFVKCPLIKESPVSIECKVVDEKKLGSHTMFIAEVLSIDASDEFIDKNGAFDISKCHLMAYANGSYFALGKKLGKFGYSVQKKKNRSLKK